MIVKILATHLQEVLYLVIIKNINPGYLRGQYIGQSIRILVVRTNSQESCHLFLDFAKAFDSLNCDFLFKS